MALGEIDDALSAALRDADSPLWSVRADAGRRLAAWAERGEVVPVLQRLLLDADNTAVTQETARTLLERQDLPGLRAVVTALSRAQETWTIDQLAGELDFDPRWVTPTGTKQLIGQLEALATDEDPGIREEARRYLPEADLAE